MLFAALALILAPWPVWAAPCEGMRGHWIPRVILALHDGTREPDPRDTRLHRYAEMALNYMGYVLVYKDVAAPLDAMDERPDAMPGTLVATLSWFDRPVPDPEGFLTWRRKLHDACGTPARALAFGHPGIPLGPAPVSGRESYLARLGMRVAGPEVAIGLGAKIAEINEEMIGLETDFVLEPGTYPRMMKNENGTSHLRIMAGRSSLELVVTAPRGGYAHGSATIRPDPRGTAFWIVDPFAFFDRVLDPAPWPIPDTTTLDGRRLHFSTVKSEGWLTPLPARQFKDQPPLGSEVLAERLVAPYPDLPVTVGVLAGDMDPVTAGVAAERGRAVAERLFALDHVQPATTGRSLILDWGFFSDYDPARETNAVQAGRATQRGGGLVTSAVRTLGDAFAEGPRSALDINPGSPRKYTRVPFTVEAEISGALSELAERLPEEAPAPLFLWSGDARTFSAAREAVSAAGAAALGGGGGVDYATAPSIANLRPVAAPSREHVQVYDALSGDAAYTRHWTKTLNGFQALAQTLERTETPRRLKPFQLSYSARSAAVFETRRAVELHLRAARAAPVMPITAERYVGIVEGFLNYRAAPDGELAWKIADRGRLQTLRFDEAGAFALDMAASRGVLGARRKEAVLYIALDPDAKTPRVALVENAAAMGVVRETDAPVLSESRLDVRGMERDACTSRAAVKGFAEGEMVWIGHPETTYEVALFGVGDDAERLLRDQIATDAAGRLALTLPVQAGQDAELVLSAPCAEG